MRVVNAAAIIVAPAVLILAWLYRPAQFMWGVILVFLMFLLVGYVNIMPDVPWRRGSAASDAAITPIALFVLLFSWFYVHDQFCIAAYAIFLLLSSSSC